jgi:hypothetical protein
LDNVRKKRGHRKLKEKELDWTLRRSSFRREYSYRPVARHTKEWW